MKIKARINQILIGVCFIALFIVIDQVIKSLISHNMTPYQSIQIIKDFFWIRLVHNPGAAFSILEGKTTFFVVITIAALIIFSIMFLNTNDDINHVGLAMLLGGTLGNALDRARLGYVVDYLDFYIFGYDFPVFNFADIMICVGVVVLCVGMIHEYKAAKYAK